MKIGRNQPCPCGSGKKHKNCCGRPLNRATSATFSTDRPDIAKLIDRRRAEEQIREDQQGLGRPIIAFKANDQQFVAVANTVFWSKKWKTFPDFLGDYIKQILDAKWGNAEIAKPLCERHPILQWYDAYCRYQNETIKTLGVVHSARVTGIVACYLGLAYNLYLLNHNVELQTRLLKRLKDPGNFQGAYFELIVANVLIRAGFTLKLEDETDGASKHCEFAAVSKTTGKRYWVEAKMRAVSGLFGKTNKDGTNDKNPISHMIPHLNAALAKPATDERLIFIDLNSDVSLSKDTIPIWIDRAIARLKQYESKELSTGTQAYVFITNLAYHRMLDDDMMTAAVPFGLGIQDFNKPGYMRLSEAWRRKQKHIDMFNISAALLKYPHFPVTFDGSLPSESLDGALPRVMIGETYFFEGVGDGGLVGTVTAANVIESQCEVHVGLTDQGGTGHILRFPISTAQLADYKAHPDVCFGAIRPAPRNVKDKFEIFEWLMQVYKELSTAELLERLAKHFNVDTVKNKSHSELLAEYCEIMTASVEAGGVRVQQ